MDLYDELFCCALESRSDQSSIDRVILCPSILSHLARELDSADDKSLFTFLVEANDTSLTTSALEFTAEEGYCYLPAAMMDALRLREMDLVTVRRCFLRPCTKLVLRPLDEDFLDIEDFRGVLEAQMHKYSVVQQGQLICVDYLDRTFALETVDLEPDVRATLIDTDIELVI
jgi:ubiquitin fusion degradation protein 1